MPVDMSKYPRNWPLIRKGILSRAGNCCERCGVPNHVYRWGKTWHLYANDLGEGQWEGRDRYDEFGTVYNSKPARIVLTIAHIHDPDPMNCDYGNLQALCQRCHNRLDAPMRAQNAKKTRQQKTGQQESPL